MNKTRINGNECLVSLALEHGCTLEDAVTANQALIDERKLPNCLPAGDVVTLPESHSGVTLKLNQHHVIQLTPLTYQLPFRLLDIELKPVADVNVILAHLGAEQPLTQRSNADGIVRFTLPLSCTKGLITCHHQDNQQVTRLFFTGHLLPPNWESGIKQRLNNFSANAQCPLNNPQVSSAPVIQALAEETGQSEQAINDLLTGDI